MQGTSSHTLIWHKWVLCSSEGRCGTVKTEQTLRESNGKVHRKQKFWLLPLWDPTLYIDKLFILNESIWIIFIKERLNLNFPNNSSKSYKLLYWKWHFNCLNAAGVPKIVKQILRPVRPSFRPSVHLSPPPEASRIRPRPLRGRPRPLRGWLRPLRGWPRPLRG